jgi:hypothetical protein
MLPDMLRVVVSIRTGRFCHPTSSGGSAATAARTGCTSLFASWGRAVRSMLLLRYLSDLELRHVINTATTKSERFNKFVEWVAFGGDSVIAEKCPRRAEEVH